MKVQYDVLISKEKLILKPTINITRECKSGVEIMVEPTVLIKHAYHLVSVHVRVSSRQHDGGGGVVGGRGHRNVCRVGSAHGGVVRES